VKPHDYANLPSVAEEVLPVPVSLRERMLLRVKQEDLQQTKHNFFRSPLVHEVRTLEEFTEVLKNSDGMVAAIWYSPWCRACHSMVPGVQALAKHHPHVKFIQIPVIDENSNLHQGLEVPSVPFVHLYLPDVQLAEESKMNKKKLPAFHKLLQDYEEGSCSLERLDHWSTSCPYSFPSSSSSPRTTVRNQNTPLP
jgi:thiol-disulfide isomerase/thioredoxin